MNFFSYESKPMQVLMYIGDLIILNLLFLLCCLPIFTIGAAHAALYSGIRVLQDPDDDSSPSKAFFTAFRTGFGQITLAWCIIFVATLAMGYVSFLCAGYREALGKAPLWMAVAGTSILAVFTSQVTLFHSRFACTAWQLLRNCWFLTVAHPLRSLLMAFLTWLPIIMFYFMDVYTFIGTTPIWMLLLYSTVALFNFAIMKKPFKTLIDHYTATHSEESDQTNPDEEEAPAEETE